VRGVGQLTLVSGTNGLTLITNMTIITSMIGYRYVVPVTPYTIEERFQSWEELLKNGAETSLSFQKRLERSIVCIGQGDEHALSDNGMWIYRTTSC
jgi:hypothetical protein